MKTSEQEQIHIKGARVHNLCNLEVRMPRGAFTVITGVSGSGKSSLAFDTLYAEGYRKYMDSLSTRARQVLEQLPRPDVDFIHGLSPVIAIEQRTGQGANPRSTVGSVTEIADYARLLWSVQGEAFCPLDGGRIVRWSLDDCLERIYSEAGECRIMILAPVLNARPAILREELPRLVQKGFQRVRIRGEIRMLDEPRLVESGWGETQVEVVVDRLVVRPDQRSRIADSLELAFREGEDRALILVEDPGSEKWREIRLSQHLACENCGAVYDALSPRHFSWNHAEGACSTCGGLGETRQFLEELLVPDPTKSVRNGAVKPWRLGSKAMIIRRNAILKQLAEQVPFEANAAWKDLDAGVRRLILHGDTKRLFSFKLKRGNSSPVVEPFPGVISDLEQTWKETSSDGLRARLSAYQVAQPCPDCGGQRLNARARAVRLAGTNIVEFYGQSTERALKWVGEKLLDREDLGPVGEAIHGLQQRLHFLNETGLGYLTLNRAYNTLSGGEAQRVRLATQLGMGLVGVTYVLDEPTIGLHPMDNLKLIRMLLDLRDRGNTVVVVEHDTETIRAADYLVELGPGAGEEGGRLVFSGLPQEAIHSPKSLTGAFLSGALRVERESPVGVPVSDHLVVRGAREHNLKDIDVGFPVGRLSVVCGVSGSGKSTLVNDVLGQAAALRLNRARVVPGRHRGLDGLDHFDRVVRVDQDPIGRSPRSNPATFTKVFDLLRDLFARTPLARVRGYRPKRFSFNVAGGRCERCRGDGMTRLDMQFLGDVFVECPSCGGRRYNRETLEIRYRGHSIADVLDLSVSEAMRLFAKHPRLMERLKTLEAVGLGYLRLGQSAPTLSGGEAQRLKLSLELSKRQQGRTLYILDEPTTGLHWVDIQRLMDLLFMLRDAGNTVIVIEHNLDVIRLADWIVELGPEGGEKGGQLIFHGTVDALLIDGKTPTGECLGRVGATSVNRGSPFPFS